MLVTVYAEYFSIIMKVGLWSNIVLAGCCAILFVIEYRSIKEYLQRLWMQMKSSDRGRKIIYIMSLMIFGILFICVSAQKKSPCGHGLISRAGNQMD